jgi:hypothetical protein
LKSDFFYCEMLSFFCNQSRIKNPLYTGPIFWAPWLTAGDFFWHKSNENVKKAPQAKFLKNVLTKPLENC